MNVQDILNNKGKDVVTINVKSTVKQAVEALIKHNIGAVVVVDDEITPVGIVSERDVLREIHHRNDVIHETRVDRIMSTDLIVGVLEDSLEYVRCTFTQNRIRHLPILEQGTMTGIISIGDVVKSLLKEKDSENRYLRDFITDKYPR